MASPNKEKRPWENRAPFRRATAPSVTPTKSRSIVGVFWDGQDCVAASGCRCEGADCGNGYVDIASCEAEHAACGNQQDDCVVGGCSGQLCYDPAIDGGITTCEWREEYACYAQATCKRQPSGQCGWTQTLELQMCLSSSSCPTLSPPSPNFCGQNGPNPIPNYDENGCVTGYECPSTTDCRSSGCGRGSNCSWCWGSYACLPDGAVC